MTYTVNRFSHNLLVKVEAFVCKYQEDCDLLLTLYDGDDLKTLTENYVVKWSRQGIGINLDDFANHRVMFTVRILLFFFGFFVFNDIELFFIFFF